LGKHGKEMEKGRKKEKNSLDLFSRDRKIDGEDDKEDFRGSAGDRRTGGFDRKCHNGQSSFQREKILGCSTVRVMKFEELLTVFLDFQDFPDKTSTDQRHWYSVEP
jgi:hypothetical protein